MKCVNQRYAGNRIYEKRSNDDSTAKIKLPFYFFNQIEFFHGLSSFTMRAVVVKEVMRSVTLGNRVRGELCLDYTSKVLCLHGFF